MFKFIHAADLHLDSPLRGLERYEGAPIDSIRIATRRALENLVQLALTQQVDFVLIAGDLYDGQWKDHHTGLFLTKQMSYLRAAGIPVVMILGNHDAASRMTQSLKLPDNVELLSTGQAATASHPRFATINVAVHGQSFAQPAELDNMVPGYPAAVAGKFNIGMLHTSLVGTVGHDPYAPCSIEELRQKNYDYWALGHVHQRQIIAEDPWVVYSGNTQGRHIKESGAKGCYVVTVDSAGGVTPHFVSLDVIRWESCLVDTSALLNMDELVPSFMQALGLLRQTHLGYPLAVRVILQGACSFHGQLLSDWRQWTNELRAVAIDYAGDEVWIEQIKLETTPTGELCMNSSIDGPVHEVLDYVQLLCDQPLEIQPLLDELSDLRRKLPSELLEEFEGLADIHSDQWERWLADAQTLILQNMAMQRTP